MTRYSRDRYFAFGVLQAVSAVAMLLYGLGLATHGTGGPARSIPFLVVLAALCLLASTIASIKRGRDLGWKPVVTFLALFVGIGMGPLFLVLVAYLAFAPGDPGENVYGQPSQAMSNASWVWAMLGIICPWALLWIVGRLL